MFFKKRRLDLRQGWFLGGCAFDIEVLLLIDGLSAMYEDHISPPKERMTKWKQVVCDMSKDVEAEYGNIRIVQVAKAICKNTDW